MSRKHMEDALAHELVHAYDSRRFRPIAGDDSWAEDLRAHACTEVSIILVSGCSLAPKEKPMLNADSVRRHSPLADPGREPLGRLQIRPRVHQEELELHKAASSTFHSLYNALALGADLRSLRLRRRACAGARSCRSRQTRTASPRRRQSGWSTRCGRAAGLIRGRLMRYAYPVAAGF